MKTVPACSNRDARLLQAISEHDASTNSPPAIVVWGSHFGALISLIDCRTFDVARRGCPRMAYWLDVTLITQW
jgi:hypothetical protein